MAKVFVFGVPGDDAEGLIDYSLSILKGGTKITYVKTDGKTEEEILGEMQGENVILSGYLLKPTILGLEPQLSADFFQKAGIKIMIFLDFWFLPRESRELHQDVEIIRRSHKDLEELEGLEQESQANKAYAIACAASSKALFKSIRVNKGNIKAGLEALEEFYKGVF